VRRSQRGNQSPRARWRRPDTVLMCERTEKDAEVEMPGRLSYIRVGRRCRGLRADAGASGGLATDGIETGPAASPASRGPAVALSVPRVSPSDASRSREGDGSGRTKCRESLSQASSGAGARCFCSSTFFETLAPSPPADGGCLRARLSRFDFGYPYRLLRSQRSIAARSMVPFSYLLVAQSAETMEASE
jgi:hypothetical protein